MDLGEEPPRTSKIVDGNPYPRDKRRGKEVMSTQKKEFWILKSIKKTNITELRGYDSW